MNDQILYFFTITLINFIYELFYFVLITFIKSMFDLIKTNKSQFLLYFDIQNII